MSLREQEIYQWRLSRSDRNGGNSKMSAILLTVTAVQGNMTEKEVKRMGKKNPTEMRSESMNPVAPAGKAALDNRSNQLNPNNPAYRSSRGHK